MSRFMKVLLLAVVMLALSIGCAWAADVETLAQQINDWDHGGTGTLSATVTGENEVTVTGDVTGALKGFMMMTNAIPAPVTIKWDANLTGSSGGSEIGTWNIFDGATIPPEETTYGFFPFISFGGQGEFILNGSISTSLNKTTISLTEGYDEGYLATSLIISSSGIVSNYSDNGEAVTSGEEGSPNTTVEPGGRIEAPTGAAVRANKGTVTGDMSGVVGAVIEYESGDPAKVEAKIYGTTSAIYEELNNSARPTSITIINGASVSFAKDFILAQDTNLTVQSGSKLTIDEDTTFTINGTAVIEKSAILENKGIIIINSINSLINRGTINNLSTGTINNNGHFNNETGVVNNSGMMVGTEEIGGTVNDETDENGEEEPPIVIDPPSDETPDGEDEEEPPVVVDPPVDEIPDESGEEELPTEEPPVVNPPSGNTSGSGGGGCNTGFMGILAVLALAAPFLTSRKK